jgi:hypothetical protein
MFQMVRRLRGNLLSVFRVSGVDFLLDFVPGFSKSKIPSHRAMDRSQTWTSSDPFGNHLPGSSLDWANNVFFFSFAPKWFSRDGLHFTLVFTGGGNGKDNDSFNTV